MATSMEVDTVKSNVMASAGTSGSVSVSLHPLVIMNVSEHWTRTRAQEGQPRQVLGALIGKQKGRNIEVMNSFELYFDFIDDQIVIDMEYYNTKEEQFKQVFSEMDFLGWYTTGDVPTDSDIHVHKQICTINESPIMLKMNPQARNQDLPVAVYESVIDLVNGEATMLFVELQYTLATEEAERIGVDHVARMSTADTGESSSVAEQLIAQHSAIKMLYSRVKLILEYIKAVEAGELPKNQDVLREAYSLCYRLPVLNTATFKEDFFNFKGIKICDPSHKKGPSGNSVKQIFEKAIGSSRGQQCNDVCLMAYLGTITKGCNTINQFVNKFNVIHDRHSMGRRMRGLFF